MDVKVTVWWHCWHCHATLTNTRVSVPSKCVSCELICFLSVCLVGKSCAGRIFLLEVSWKDCFSEIVTHTGCVAYGDSCHGSS